MTNGPTYLDDVQPSLIPARVSIHHLQLRDLLQPAGVKHRVLFVNRLKIEQADFTTQKPPSTYCTLDFLPNCLTTACGLLAAGGQHSELALRPLHTPSSSASSLDPEADRYPAPWLLRTPTGGSINNAISIHPDRPAEYASSAASSSHLSATSSSARNKRPPIQVTETSSESNTIWARDEPRSASHGHSSSYASASTSSASAARRHTLFQSGEDHEWQIDDRNEREETAAAYGFEPSSSTSLWRNSSSRRTTSSSRIGDAETVGAPPAAATEASPYAGPIRIMVSNNDQSIKSYKLRPPQGSPGAGGRIESGLPGLSKTSTLNFPTAINHSSLSPDRRTLLAVGDTPEVFVYNARANGDFEQVATYTASTDASFSTTWSPDGSKFAVASQDGIVSVWDVRSSNRLAQLHTSQVGGNGAARVVKFSPHGDMLAFTEHRNYFHVVDTVSFANVQRIAAPSAPPPTSGTLRSGGTALSTGEGGGGGEADDDSSGPGGGLPSRFGITGTGTGTGTGTTGTGPNASYRMQVLLNTAQGHRETIDRFRIASSTSTSAGGTASTPNASSTSSTVNDLLSRAILYDSLLRRPEELEDLSSASSSSSSTLPGATTWSVQRRDRRRTLTELMTDEPRSVPSAAGRRRDESTAINISGLCWDGDGEYLYVSTERVIGRYTVLDPRQVAYGADFL